MAFISLKHNIIFLSGAILMTLFNPSASYCVVTDPEIPKCQGKGKSYLTQDGCCVEEKYWCKLSLDRPDCNTTEHLLFDNCLQITDSYGDYEYIYTGISTDWQTAEQFCNSKGYNLLYFTSRDEPMRLVDTIVKKFSMPRAMESSKEYDYYSDPVHQLCWFDKLSLDFWTGLYFDQITGTWETTAGVPVQGNAIMKARDGSQVSLGIFTRLIDQKNTQQRSKVYVAVKQKEADFADWYQEEGSVDGPNIYPKAICKRRKQKSESENKMPPVWTPDFEIEKEAVENLCITGYTCQNTTRCLRGLQFGEESDLLDGYADCPLGDDEDLSNLQSIRALANSTERHFVFYPIMKSMHEVERLCKTAGMTLPSIHDMGDVAILNSLPVLFDKNMTTTNFIAHKHPWNSQAVHIPLGVTANKKKFSDGSAIPMMTFPDPQNVNLSIFERRGEFAIHSEKIVTDLKKTKRVMLVCQETSRSETISQSQISLRFMMLVAFICFW